MKYLFLSLFLLFSGTSFSQYFNIFPTICDSTASGEFHYVIGGVENFNDSLTDSLELHVELLTHDDSLDLITSRSYVLSDTSATANEGLTRNLSEHTFSVDLGTFPSGDYMLHIWVVLAGAVTNEVYYHQ
jgi:hypothetical protein